MLNVCTPQEVLSIINNEFKGSTLENEVLPISNCIGRILAEDITADEYVPDFNRSTVDGYAVKAADTFGCSDSIPALLTLAGEVKMGESADFEICSGCCAYVPTGAEIPIGADAVIMIEYSEDYGDGTIGISKSAAPGGSIIFRGDDVFPGKCVLKAGRKLRAEDIGALAAMGKAEVVVCKKPKIAVFSTGDELIPHTEKPQAAQIRDTNSPMLCAALNSYGADAVACGIIRDERELLMNAVRNAAESFDIIVISGGSSVGMKDATCSVIEELGTLLLHGIAMKPGKPTIIGKIGKKPVIGLPGHPAAAFFVTDLFIKELINVMQNAETVRASVTARLTEAVSANHGRAQYTSVILKNDGEQLLAVPIRSKSGLISTLAGANGYFCIPRDSEGCAKDEEINVFLR